jgi:hypothetical protein
VDVQPGRCYFRKTGQTVSVRKVERVEGGDVVHYRVLAGPQLRQREENRTRLKKFLRWATGETDERDDYSDLGGCAITPTFLVHDTRGEPIFRCTERKARFYLRKGHAVEVSPGVLRLTDATTEERLREVHRGEFDEFFLAVKNDRCVACGAAGPLTRHHVVPRRVLGDLPHSVRARLSNVLYVCVGCHERYERSPEPAPDEPDPLAYCRAWQEHLVEVLRPRFLPEGWDVISVKHAPEDEED